MKWLETHGVITVSNCKVHKLTNEDLSNRLLDTRENDPYDIDGVICINDEIYERTQRKCPKHAFAFKMVLSDQIMESQVVNVLWQISKNGYIIPKIQVVPVEIGGVTITFASAHNAAFIEKNNIGIGAVVQIVRSGDVIPKIEAVIKPADAPLMPDLEYVWNSSHVDIILKNVEENKTVHMMKILAFVQTLDVPGFGPGNVKKVFDIGFDTIPKVLCMCKDDFMTIPGFKEKLSDKIHNGIRERIGKIGLADLMVATNIFGRGLGRSRAKMILKNYPNILTSDASDEQKMRQVESLDGFARKTAETFVPYIPQFMEFIVKTNMMYKLEVKAPEIKTGHPLYQKKIVMTGFRDKELQNKIIEVGGEISNSVNKNTFILLVDSLESDSGKAEKARNLKIKMITPYAFHNQYFE
jgi:NAD-dependent DNA ligase